ncbi:MAG TPA: GtrA family protein [Streptosporangiaceae bacterium]|nr:GtrA family protein [Streptosporangiaceae bacterium]
MSIIRGLYTRFRQLIHEGAKFGVVGLIGVAISFGGATVLRFDVGLGKYTSVTVATGVATLVAFIGNRYWTFRHRERVGTARETVMFFALNGVGLIIQYACIGIAQDALGLPGTLSYNIANLIGIALGTLFRFWAYRKWVWASLMGEPQLRLPRAGSRRYGGRHRASPGSRKPLAGPPGPHPGSRVHQPSSVRRVSSMPK